MAFNFPLYSISFLVGGVLALFFALVIWRRRPTPGAAPFTFLMVAIAVWLFNRLLEAGAVEFSVKVFWGKVENLGIVSVGILLLFFALDYCGITWWRRPRNLLLLYMLPLLSFIVSLTNDWHYWYWSNISPSPGTSGTILMWEHGPWFWLIAFYNYAAIIISIVILWRYVLRRPIIYHRQVALLLIGTLIPLIGNLIYLLGYSPIQGLDLTPFAFVLAGFVYAVSIFGFHFIDVIPVAYKKLVEGLPDGIAVLNNNGYILALNQAAARILETDVSTAFRKPIGVVWKPWLEIIQSNISWDGQAELAPDKTGIGRYLEVVIKPLANNSKVIGRLVVLRDITEHKLIQQKLEAIYNEERSLRNNLQEEINKRSYYTRALVHELKTPLTAILVSGELLEGEIHDNILSELIKNVRRASLNLGKRIDELLDLARGETGTLRIELSPIDIKQAIHEVVAEMTPITTKKGILLSSEIPEEVPLVLGDGDRLRQVMANLLTNAIKYTNEGKIIVRAGRFNGDYLLVQVEDTGQGMDKERMSHLFDPYQQERTETEKLGGMGIGLALSKIFVELHNGRIWVESSQGKGSIFSFTVPILKEEKKS